MFLSQKGSLGRNPMINRVGQRLLQLFEGASAAYSLRNLASNIASVVRVRRASDNSEKDFSAADISSGAMTGWVNSQIVPPLDIGIETEDGRIPVPEGGTSIGTPAAAYSLRSLGTDQWEYAGDTVTYTSDFSAGVDGWSPDSGSSATTTPDPVGTLDVVKYTVDTETSAKWLFKNALNIGQQYSVQAEVYVPSSNVDLDSIVLMDGSGNMATSYLGIQRDEWVTVSTVGTATLIFISIRGASGTTASAYNGFQGNGTDVFYVRNVVISETLGDSNYLPAGKYVTQVRRSSDDAVKSFTAAEVSDGTLEAWVNTDVDKLDLQAESGGLAGNVSNETATSFDFSVNNEGSTGFKSLAAPADAGTYVATFDVVLTSGSLSGITLASALPFAQTSLVLGSNSVTLNPDETSGIYFRTAGTAVADVSITNITLTQTSADGHVKTWYDQSGNGNHATQTDAAKQPKIISGGVLVTRNGDAAIKSTSNDGMTFTLDSLSADGQQSVFGVLENDVTSQDSYVPVFLAASTSTAVGGVNRRPYWFIAPTGYLGLTVDSYSGYNNTSRERHLYSHVMNDTASGTSTVYQDGTQVDTRSITLDANATFNGGQVLGVSTNATGALYMSEVIYYTSDQSDNRTAIEANIGETYGITGIPAYDNTVDGFVETWYDQSGNGNHATQSVIANQPKIVDGGVLVVDRDGKVALNGKGAKLSLPSNAPMLSSDGTYSLFSVVDFDDQRNGNDDFNNIFRFESKTDGGASTQRKPLVYLQRGNGTLAATSPSYVDGSVILTSEETLSVRLLTNIANPALSTGNNTAYADGVLVASSDTNTDINTETLTSVNTYIFETQETTVTHFLSEVIYYPSDQSDNRTAIEGNIAAAYGDGTWLSGVDNYLRPDALSLYRRPDATSLYKRPLI